RAAAGKLVRKGSSLPADRQYWRIMEVVPTHDDQGEPAQLFESPDGSLYDLPWPVLVVYAPPSRPQGARVRHPRSAHPVLRRGDAAGFRDAPDPQTDTKFVKDAFWQELIRLMGVKVARTTPYNPRLDGQAEGTNRVVEDMLRSFMDANAADWDL
ncbi:hypothetical protein CYMTET_33030, partial [Cymbomonas tetramitiformis]